MSNKQRDDPNAGHGGYNWDSVSGADMRPSWAKGNAEAFPRESEHRFSNNPIDRKEDNRPHALFLKALAAWSPYAPGTHCPKKCAVCGEAYWLGADRSDLDRRTPHAAGCWVLEAEILLGINTAEAEARRRR